MFNCRMLIIGLLLMIATTPLHAQNSLKYGEPVTGEITDDVPEQTYTFFGKTDEVVVISMSPVNPSGDLDRTMMILRDPDGGTVAEYDGFGASALFALLPANGDYTIHATRPVEDDSIGEYTLAVTLIPELALGESASNTASTQDGAHFYLYRGDVDFYLSYAKQAGDFGPEVSVNIIGDAADGQLDVVGALRGQDVELGSIGVFDGGELYIIALSRALFEFSFGERTATYTLNVLDATKLE